MYARSVKDKVLTFAVSGWLWNRSLVMVDKETKTQWSHILGEGKKGELKGARLDQHPSLMTDWGTWRRLHPKTTIVLRVRNQGRTATKFVRRFYKSANKNIVFGVVLGADEKAWKLDRLPALLNDKVGDRHVLVTFDAGSYTARLFDRTLDGKLLTFRLMDGEVMDEETKSVWHPLHGKAMSGRLKGKELRALPAIESFDWTWKIFHPDSEYGP